VKTEYLRQIDPHWS